MCDIISQKDLYILTYKTVIWPTGWDSSVCLLAGYDASKWLTHCNSVKFVWSGEIKQLGMGWSEYTCEIICQLNVSRRTKKTTSRTSGWYDIVVLLGGYDASHWLRYCNTVSVIQVVKWNKWRRWWFENMWDIIC